MKSYLLIGIGKFGHHLCNNLLEYGCEVMIVDSVEEKIEDLLPVVTSAKIGDCTNPKVLESLGIKNFDACFVCIAEDFQDSLEITSLLKEMGARKVISRADRDIQAKFLLKNGADEVIYPDKDIAEKVAKRYSKENIFDYIELNRDYGIYEIEPFDEIIGKSVIETNFRSRYDANIIGCKKDGKVNMMVSPGYVFRKDEHLIIVANSKKIEKYL